MSPNVWNQVNQLLAENIAHLEKTQVCFSSSKRDLRYFTQGVPEATEPLLRVESHLFTVTRSSPSQKRALLPQM